MHVTNALHAKQFIVHMTNGRLKQQQVFALGNSSLRERLYCSVNDCLFPNRHTELSMNGISIRRLMGDPPRVLVGESKLKLTVEICKSIGKQSEKCAERVLRAGD